MSIELSTLLQANAKYVGTFNQGQLPHRPTQRLAILTCMDVRIDPLAGLGLRLGDAHVLRNAGGRVSPDVVHSLKISQQRLGTDTIVVIHHTECGMATFTDEQFREEIKVAERIKALGKGAYEAAKGVCVQGCVGFGDSHRRRMALALTAS